jgi:spore coat polysaccharide biosynthesis protein SpsF|tara:strand:- start:31 stop:810 length:780 start_codon:yes stop_codon:yes gene_type:complete
VFHVIIQARIGSSRLPGKVLKTHNNINSLDIIIKKLKKIKKITKIILATTKNTEDKIFFKYCKKRNIDIFRGNENDVLKRFYDCAKKFKSKNIIRITSDCPFVDMRTLRKMINIQLKHKFEYLANTYPLPCKFPDGSDIEFFSFFALKKTHQQADLPSDKEHVTKYMTESKKFRTSKINIKKDYSNYRYTLDTHEDFKLFCNILDNFGIKKILTLKMEDLIQFLDQNPKIVRYQKKLKRNFGWKSSLEKDKLHINEKKS